MYHFYFNLPKNDKNAGTVFLPNKKSENLPVIISCYGCDKSHWAKRVEDEFMKFIVNKHNVGFVTIKLYGADDESSEPDIERWTNNLSDMVAWVAAKKFTDKTKIGMFAYGAAVEAALNVGKTQETAFSILTVNNNSEFENVLNTTLIPTLLLQGTTDKITLQTKKFMVDNVIYNNDPVTKSASIVFVGADYYLYSIVEQASDEIAKWMVFAGII